MNRKPPINEAHGGSSNLNRLAFSSSPAGDVAHGGSSSLNHLASLSSPAGSGEVNPSSSLTEPIVTGNFLPLTKPPTASEQSSIPFVPSLGAWAKRIKITPELKDSIPHDPPSFESQQTGRNLQSDILPPEIKENGQLRFPWAAKMDPKIRNLYRTTSPSYLDDGTPLVEIPNHVLMQGLENQKEYLIGRFYRCSTPSGGLIHAMANRIWGKKCKISSRKLGESSFLFHIPDESTRAWVLERRLWHFDGCIMFVAPWTPVASLALPEITSVPLWVTLKNIPNCLYSHWGISWIASGLGEPMISNKLWLDPNSMGEAKLMVEVELDKNFPQRIAAADKQENISRCLGLDQHITLDQNCSVVTIPTVVDVCVKEVAAQHDVPPVGAETATVSTSVVVETVSTPVVAETVVEILPPSVVENVTSSVTETDVARADKTPNAKTTTSPHDAVIFSTPSPIASLANDTTQGNVLGGNDFAISDRESFAGYESGDAVNVTRGGRQIKPSQKILEMEWSTVSRRGKGGRGGKKGRASPPLILELLQLIAASFHIIF